MESVSVIVVAGGTGDRFRGPGGKQLALIGDLPMLAHTCMAIERCARADELVIVAHPERVEEYTAAIAGSLHRLVPRIVPGGNTRQDSVAAGLAEVSPSAKIVAVHDGARPLVSDAVVTAAIEAVENDPSCAGAIAALPAYDTVKEVSGDTVAGTTDRDRFWLAHTPQVFRVAALREAYAAAVRDEFLGTDDSSLVERIGGKVRVVADRRDNIKVTLPEDLALAEALIRAREREGGHRP